MNLPSQFTLRDTFENLLLGLLYILLSIFYIWHFTGLDILMTINNWGLLGFLVIIAIGYSLGVLVGGLINTFSYLLRLSVNSPIKPLRKFDVFIGRFLFGLKLKPDGRIMPFEEETLNNLAKTKIKNLFNINFESLDNKSKRQFFYVAYRYTENYYEGDVPEVERRHLTTNLYSNFIGLFLTALFINSIAICLKFLNQGNLSVTILSVIEVAIIIVIRIISHAFQESLLQWWKNVWRTFLILETKNVLKNKPNK